jgi:hypothetical protein
VNGYITGEADPQVPGGDETIPEPATWTAVLSGLGALGYARFRQQKRAG